MKRVVLLGGGGHAKCVIDAMRFGRKYIPYCILALNGGRNARILEVPVAGSDSDLPAYYRRGLRLCFIALGSIGNPARRIALWEMAAGAGFEFPTIIHPSAVVSSSATIGKGVYVGPGAIINAGANIGDGCIVNTGAIIEHDCRIGDFAHIAPGCALSGDVTIGESSHVGTGTCIRQGIVVGKRTILGVGSVVVSDLPSGAVCVGNPCAMVRNKR